MRLTGSVPFTVCFEGLASGPALEQRLGQPAEQISPEHQIWELEAEYIAQALHTLICVVSPQKIILGGGVMNQRHLFPRIWRKVQTSLNGYLPLRELQAIDRYIVPPALGALSGVLGAIALARAHEVQKD